MLGQTISQNDSIYIRHIDKVTNDQVNVSALKTYYTYVNLPVYKNVWENNSIDHECVWNNYILCLSIF